MNLVKRNETTGNRLIVLGIVLFLAGLITGFIIPLLENPRVGLSSHLEGVLNGVFLIALGAVWPRLALSARTGRIASALLVFGAFANWLATLLAGIWGTGAMMPIAAAGRAGSSLQEASVGALLMTLSIAMVVSCVMLLWSMVSRGRQDSDV
jgi:hydroxylaminobenzene mutase